ncbi:MAG TPA: LamG domain-containing protein [Steroidobacteraceae bacterium]|jgi:mono/diheme cytochrome c family protein
MTCRLNFDVARLAAIAVVAAVLAGCSGGAPTERNPETEGPSAGPDYTGPAPMTADIQAFRVNFWENIRGTDRCGSCHNAGGQAPQFARSDDVNLAYEQANTVVNRENPSQSIIVTKVGGGHNCWLADAGACASILTRWIQDWVGASGSGGRQIELEPPTPRDPGASKRFPATPPPEFGAVYNLLDEYCSDCHQSDAPTSQSPYFAAGARPFDPSSAAHIEAYNAAIPKINLDNPAQSRFVIRLADESHNCWSNCADNAAELLAAIQAMADAIPVSQVDPSLIVSKALTLYEGTIASGGNRYENNVIALYEFKTGSGNIAFDTSGVQPEAHLTLSGDYSWFGGWGINIRSGKAQASTTASRKLHQLITATGEYSIEAWVIPGNVTQEDARIVSYSGSTTARNFTMGQTLYNYDFYNRSTATDANGAPALSTADADERLQATLQHVVMTFDPVNGRRIYVNGEFTGDVDSAGGGTLGDWDNSFALVLGNEVSNNRQWMGVIRLVAIHNRALTPEQIRQNFEAGVGEKFFLLFGIEHIVDVPQSYIMFEAAQYDSAGYLFTNPRFISLDPTAMPGSIRLQGMRIGVNGAEPLVGQAYRLLDVTIDDASYSPSSGQLLSNVGTIIGIEQGPESDEFFLCFDQLGDEQNICSEYAPAVAVPPTPVAPPSDIGVRTFDAINATMSALTGVSANNASVKNTFTTIRESLPAVPDMVAFLSSHQTSIAQLALQYCNVLVDDTNARRDYFPALNWASDISTQRAALVDPLVERMIGDVATQPTAEAEAELNNLITALCANGSCSSSPATRTPIVAKAVCGAALGSAATLVQ